MSRDMTNINKPVEVTAPEPPSADAARPDLLATGSIPTPPTAPPAPPPVNVDNVDTPPLRVGSFIVDALIGHGGYGVVYTGRHQHLHYPVAIKVLRSTLGANEREFRREAERLARLRSHPGIVQIYDYGTYTDPQTTRSHPYFVMEMVPGSQSITQFARASDLSLARKLALFARVCDAVEHAHRANVLHLDLKPANILVWPSARGTPDQPTLIDLGIARAADPATDDGPRHVRGTFPYMSPEQTEENAPLDARSDTYSLGVVLYELLCGALPYKLARKSESQIIDTIRHMPADTTCQPFRDLPSDVQAILERALDKNRENRFQSAAEFARDIRQFLKGELPDTVQAGPLRKLARSITRALAEDRGLAAIVAVVLSVLFTHFFIASAVYSWTSAGTFFEVQAGQGAAIQRFDRVKILDYQMRDLPELLAWSDPKPPEAWRGRRLLADALDIIRESAPRTGAPAAIAIDILFERPSTDESVDQNFARAIQQLDPISPVILGVKHWAFTEDQTAAPHVLSPPLARIKPRLGSVFMQGGGPTPSEAKPWSIELALDIDKYTPFPALSLITHFAALRPSDRAHVVHFDIDASEILVQFTKTHLPVPPFSDTEPTRVRVTGVERARGEAGQPQDHRILTALMSLSLPPREVFQAATIDLRKILARDESALRALAGRVVLIANVGSESDVHQYPGVGLMPGPYAHATAIEMLVAGTFRRPDEASVWTLYVGAALAGVGVPFLIRRRKPYRHHRTIAAWSVLWIAILLLATTAAILLAWHARYFIHPLMIVAPMFIAAAFTLWTFSIPRRQAEPELHAV